MITDRSISLNIPYDSPTSVQEFGQKFQVRKVHGLYLCPLTNRRKMVGLGEGSMFRKFLLYGLPLYMYVLELLLKQFANMNADSVAGPTLAGAGIGFLLPLTELKRPAVDQALLTQLKNANIAVYSPKDKAFSDGVWFAFFFSLLGWMYSIFLTVKRSGSVHTGVNWALTIGCIVFVASVVLAEFKEKM